MNEDDVLDDPVSKKAKGSSSYSKQNAGKRSRKVMTEVRIARYQFAFSSLLL
jgi:protein MAK16